MSVAAQPTLLLSIVQPSPLWHYKFLRKLATYDIGINLCELIARRGNLQVLTLARKEKIPREEQTCAADAEFGRLDVLKYAHEKGCTWDTTTCKQAAVGGHLYVLKYACEYGCPWDELTCAIVLEWAWQHGIVVEENEDEELDGAYVSIEKADKNSLLTKPRNGMCKLLAAVVLALLQGLKSADGPG
jgi:hypothetical protein